MKISILTEEGLGIGFGHAARCLSLYQAFEEKGITPRFIIKGDKSVGSALNKKRYKLFDWLGKTGELSSLIKDEDMVIVDSYLADADFYKRLAVLTKLAVYIDDNNRVSYPRGIIVNGALRGERINYPKKKDITYILGAKYAPLRREFWKIPRKRIRESPSTIMVTFGGCDFRNITSRVLRMLVREYPAITKKVIIGRCFKNIEPIKKAKDKNTDLICYPNAARMKKVMLESDIAISAGGQTMYELARVGLPAIVISVADNQLRETEEFNKAGFIDYAGWWKNKTTLSKLKVCLKKLMSYNLRLKRSNTGRRLIDGRGPRRIVDLLLKHAE